MRNLALNNLKYRPERLWRINAVSGLISRLDPNKVEPSEYQNALEFITEMMSGEMTELEEVYCEIEDCLKAPKSLTVERTPKS
ncbi:hypothetical protein [Mannheimia indoligenes]|uniref:hypothetical protein n=1 Tax=Mannheimia indoligenes TaxID=3103145 RepID=UPI002FE5E684